MRNADVRKLLLPPNRCQYANEPLFDLNLSEDILTTDSHLLTVLLNKARVNIQILHVSSRENAAFVANKPFVVLRQQVSTLLFQLRQLVICEKLHYSAVDEEIQPLTAYLDHLNALPIASVFHAVQSEKGNEVRNHSSIEKPEPEFNDLECFTDQIAGTSFAPWLFGVAMAASNVGAESAAFEKSSKRYDAKCLATRHRIRGTPENIHVRFDGAFCCKI